MRTNRAPVARSVAETWGRVFVVFSLVVWSASFVIGFRGSLLVLTVAGFGAAIVGLREPSLGLLGVGVLCTLDSAARAYLLTGGLWRWNTFNYWLLIVMVLWLPALIRLRDRQTRILQAFILVLAAGLVFTPDLMNGVQHMLNLVTILGLLLYFSRGAQHRDTWYWLAVVCSTLSGVGAVCFFLQQAGLPYVNPNAWSFLPLAGIFAINLGLPAAQARGRGQTLLVLLAALNAAAVFLSGSRGNFLIACACLIVLLIQMRHVGKGIAAVAVAAIVVLGVTSQFSRQETRAVRRFSKLLDRSRSMAERTSGRSDLAIAGWRMFLDHPLSGVGTGGFALAFREVDRLGLAAFRKEDYKQSHSGWIKVLSENGVPGIVVFSTFILSFAVIGWKRRRRGVLVLGLLVTLSLSVAFIADEFQGKGLWLLAAGGMTVLRRASVPTRRRSTAQSAAAFQPARRNGLSGEAARSGGFATRRSPL